MNATGTVEEKSAGGFNAFLYESINTRLIVVVGMAVHLPVRSFRMPFIQHHRLAVLRSSSHSPRYTCSTRVDAQDEECGHRLDQRR